MRDENKLKPCPFCGSNARLVMGVRKEGRYAYFVECVFRRCGVAGPKRERPVSAEMAWNGREGTA